MEWITLAWRFRNEIAIGLITLVLVSAGLYIKYVFNDRENLRQDIVKLQTDLVRVEKQVVLNKEIADAIAKIRIQSHNYVHVVETSTPPPAGSSFVAVPSGVFSPTVFAAYSSNRAASTVKRTEDSPAK